MLHIILLILKIIGIVLLSIVGILLFVLISVLFVPVRYRVRVEREEGEGKPPVVVSVKITWFLHLANILIQYPADVIVRVRILVFTLFRIPKSEQKAGKEKPQKRKKEKKRQDATDSRQEEHAQTILEEEKSEKVTATTGPDSSRDREDFTEQETAEDEENHSLLGKIKDIFVKLAKIVEKIKGFFQNIQYTIQKICDKIKGVLNNIQYYREVLESDSFRQSADLCVKELSRILKKLKPDKVEAALIVGMEDPAVTGEILAVFGILYPLIGRHVQIVGDFDCEKMHVEGRLYIRGKIRTFTFLCTAVRIYFNKNIKKLIRLLKKEAI